MSERGGGVFLLLYMDVPFGRFGELGGILRGGFRV